MTSCSECGGQCPSPHDNTPTAQQLSEVERSLDPCPFCGGEPILQVLKECKRWRTPCMNQKRRADNELH